MRTCARYYILFRNIVNGKCRLCWHIGYKYRIFFDSDKIYLNLPYRGIRNLTKPLISSAPNTRKCMDIVLIFLCKKSKMYYRYWHSGNHYYCLFHSVTLVGATHRRCLPCPPISHAPRMQGSECFAKEPIFL